MQMRTHKLIAAVMAAAISGTALAQTVQGSADEGFTIKAGNVTMTVSAKEGGKIMSYMRLPLVGLGSSVPASCSRVSRRS